MVLLFVNNVIRLTRAHYTHTRILRQIWHCYTFWYNEISHIWESTFWHQYNVSVWQSNILGLTMYLYVCVCSNSYVCKCPHPRGTITQAKVVTENNIYVSLTARNLENPVFGPLRPTCFGFTWVFLQVTEISTYKSSGILAPAHLLLYSSSVSTTKTSVEPQLPEITLGWQHWLQYFVLEKTNFHVNCSGVFSGCFTFYKVRDPARTFVSV